MNLVLGRLGPEDVEEAVRMIVEALHESYITDAEIQMGVALDERTVSDRAPEIYRREFMELLKDDDAFLPAARVENELAGFAVAVVEDDVVDLWDLVVKRKFRRMGIATALIGEVERFARDRGCYGIKLDVNLNNYEAIRLYERLGFRRISYIMQKGDRLRGLG
ncbi:MAG: GNAT family N-acetyltransferase [Nitrososphaeria archaeon]